MKYALLFVIGFALWGQPALGDWCPYYAQLTCYGQLTQFQVWHEVRLDEAQR